MTVPAASMLQQDSGVIAVLSVVGVVCQAMEKEEMELLQKDEAEGARKATE